MANETVTKTIGKLLAALLMVLLISGCDSRRSDGELMADAMKKCAGVVSVSITLSTFSNSVTAHCDKVVMKESGHD